MTKKVAIIGAGASGITALKVCVTEYGFDAWCLEKTHDLGGLWRYKPNECDGEASVMKSTVINTSKEMMAFSDFPPKAEYPNFMHNRDVLEYFRAYVDKFDLLKRIRYHTEILVVKRAVDHDTTGKWEIKMKNSKTGEITTEIFDAVMSCTGHHVEPYSAKINGLEKFKGTVLHSHSYKEPKGFEDKRVVVIGVGNSGGDIAVELSRISEKVYLVARRGTWVYNRIFDDGKPLDMVLTTRFSRLFLEHFPNLSVAYAEKKVNSRFDHEKYGLKPAHHIFQQHPTVNDELPNRIQCGTVIVKPEIKDFPTSNSVLFDDSSRVENIDAVILCTGYSFGFPFLEHGDLIPVHENQVRLYKQMFVPKLKHPETLGVIGCFQPLGALMPVVEMQARVFCELNKPDAIIHLPNAATMNANIDAKLKAMHARYVHSRRHTIQVDYIVYMDELADIIGVKPNPLDYATSDPRLAWALFSGPCLPYQYRLVGPHPWSHARNTIVKVWDRVWHPTRSTCLGHGKCACPGGRCRIKQSERNAMAIFIAVMVVLFLIFFIFS